MTPRIHRVEGDQSVKAGRTPWKSRSEIRGNAECNGPGRILHGSGSHPDPAADPNAQDEPGRVPAMSPPAADFGDPCTALIAPRAALLRGRIRRHADYVVCPHARSG